MSPSQAPPLSRATGKSNPSLLQDESKASTSSLSKKLSGSGNLLASKSYAKSLTQLHASQSNIRGGDGVLKTDGCIEARHVLPQGTEVHSVKFSNDDSYIACGLGTGTVKVLHAKSAEVVQSLSKTGGLAVPCTAVTWRPAPGNTTTPSSDPDGTIMQWHAQTGAVLGRIEEPDNQVLSVDYRCDGESFATAGADCMVRVYNEETKQVLTAMDTGDVSAGHSNRIFCVKWHPTDHNILVSGGWDSTLQFWDIRSGKSEKSIFGPYICGEAVDFNDGGDKILTGSYKKGQSLAVWSYGQGKEIETLPWSLVDERKSCMLYSASFSRSTSTTVKSRFIVAGGGGGGVNEIKIFNHAARRCIGFITDLPNAVFSAALSRDEKTLACGGSFNQLLICNVDNNFAGDVVY
ncbi:hypothetical protein RI367_005064 [Sorochytrium milnesiophthora]